MRFCPEPAFIVSQPSARMPCVWLKKAVEITHVLARAVLTAMFVAAAGRANGATVEAKGAGLGDVKSAVALANSGDTVMIPAGEASWTSPLIVTKGITLQG